MIDKPTVIVAGYGAWVKAPINPAAEIIKHLNKVYFDDVALIAVELPVETDSLLAHIEKLLLEYKPDAWIGIGVAAGAGAIKLEMLGNNWRHFSVPDDKGNLLKYTPVIKGGAVAYNASLPNDEIVKQLIKNEIPAEISFSAGTHLCNQMIYSCAYLTEKNNLNTLSGFVHVPQSSENVANKIGYHQGLPSMPLKVEVEALKIAINVIVDSILDD